jgi:hypothetical protein
MVVNYFVAAEILSFNVNSKNLWPPTSSILFLPNDFSLRCFHRNSLLWFSWETWVTGWSLMHRATSLIPRNLLRHTFFFNSFLQFCVSLVSYSLRPRVKAHPARPDGAHKVQLPSEYSDFMDQLLHKVSSTCLRSAPWSRTESVEVNFRESLGFGIICYSRWLFWSVECTYH